MKTRKLTLVPYKGSTVKFYEIITTSEYYKVAIGFFNQDDVYDWLDESEICNVPNIDTKKVLSEDNIQNFVTSFDGEDYARFELDDKKTMQMYIQGFLDNNTF